MKFKGSSRKLIVDTLKDKFGVPTSTCYFWFTNYHSPCETLGRLKTKENLFYVLGALLGDGYAYNWQSSYNVGILVKEEQFARKFAGHLSKCMGHEVSAYPYRKRNLWFVGVGNYELFSLFKDFRGNLSPVQNTETISKKDAIQFIEGFFDAEGCVKVIKERARKTPKICLDFTNTNYKVLEVIQNLLKLFLDIEARFSVQYDKRPNRKPVYHLRIYKKDYVRIFFENMQTTKLNKEKEMSLKNWLQLKP